MSLKESQNKKKTKKSGFRETYFEAAFGSDLESPFDLRETRAQKLK